LPHCGPVGSQIRMHKAIIFLTRASGISREAFRQWWLEEHRPLAEQLPGLERHAFNLLDEGSPYDAVVEQWFATLEDLRHAYESPAGRAVAADSLSKVSHRLRLIAEEFTFTVGEPD
jgi:uncharacterized protein (TIGR02118 family)